MICKQKKEAYCFNWGGRGKSGSWSLCVCYTLIFWQHSSPELLNTWPNQCRAHLGTANITKSLCWKSSGIRALKTKAADLIQAQAECCCLPAPSHSTIWGKVPTALCILFFFARWYKQSDDICLPLQNTREVQLKQWCVAAPYGAHPQSHEVAGSTLY